MSDKLKLGQCSSCGTMDGDHGAGCPAGVVRVVDKRGAKRQEEQSPTDDDVDSTEPPLSLEDHHTERQVRISALRNIHQLKGSLTAAQAAELLHLQVEEEEGATQPSERTQLMTAFLVLVGHDGSVTATSDVNLEMDLDRVANVDDMDAGCHIVARDIAASMTAKQVVFGLQVSAQAMQQQSQQAQMMQRLSPNIGGRRGGR